MSCHDATYLHTHYTEQKLNKKHRFFLKLHLLYCSTCKSFFTQMQTIKNAIQQGTETIKLSETAKATIERKINDAIK